MLSDVFDDSGMVRVLDYLLDIPVGPFTQTDVCREAKVSRPTAVRAFKTLKKNGLIRKIRGGYKVLWGNKTPMSALLQFDMRVTYYLAGKARK